MQINRLGVGGLLAMVALVGCGSSGGSSGTGGSTGTGGATTGHAGTTGTAGSGSGTGGHTGSGGTTGGGSFTTSVPSGTKLTGLSGAQATQLCSDINAYFNHTFIPELCNASAASSSDGLDAAYFDLLANPSDTDAQLRAACTAASADAGGSCLATANLDGGVEDCDVSSIPSTCQATVGDYAKCLDDTTSASVQYYASVPSCSTITAASLNAYFAADGGFSVGPTEPASCTMFDSTCQADGGTAAMTNMSRLPMRRRTR